MASPQALEASFIGASSSEAQYMHDLNIRLDALFLENRDNEILTCIKHYFAGMSEEKVQKYIALCEQADLLLEE